MGGSKHGVWVFVKLPWVFYWMCVGGLAWFHEGNKWFLYGYLMGLSRICKWAGWVLVLQEDGSDMCIWGGVTWFLA